MSIFSFTNKKTTQLLDENSSTNTIITGTQRDFSILKRNDYSLKVWLPEVVNVSLKELADYTGNTKSDLIRHNLFTYLYGQYDLFAIKEREDIHKENAVKNKQVVKNRTITYEPTYLDIPTFLRSSYETNRTPELGKNSYSVKVWISRKMRDDLQEQALKVELSLSHFIREILISRLFGCTYLPERKELVNFKIEIDKFEA